MKSRSTSAYRPINFYSQHSPVTIVKSTWSDADRCFKYLLSNGCLYSSNDVWPLDVVKNYMISNDYTWNGISWIQSVPRVELARGAAHLSPNEAFHNYTNMRLQKPHSGEPGLVIKTNNPIGYFSGNRLELTSGDSLSPCVPTQPQRQSKGLVTSMLRELRQYLSDHRDLIFTVVLVALVDAFFLDGALKSRLKSILSGIIDKAESKLKVDINGDGVIGPSN